MNVLLQMINGRFSVCGRAVSRSTVIFLGPRITFQQPL